MHEEHAVNQLRRHAEAIAAGLRRLAAEVEQEAGKVDRVGAPYLPHYGYVAEAIGSAVHWGVANLRVEELARWAAEADVAQARAATAEGIAADIEATIGGYPDNAIARPKVERGGHLNDAAWAAQIARERREG